jgi:hypothetical protein
MYINHTSSHNRNQSSDTGTKRKLKKKHLGLPHCHYGVIYCGFHHHGGDATNLTKGTPRHNMKIKFISVNFPNSIVKLNYPLLSLLRLSIQHYDPCQLLPYFVVSQPEHYYFYPIRPQIKIYSLT